MPARDPLTGRYVVAGSPTTALEAPVSSTDSTEPAPEVITVQAEPATAGAEPAQVPVEHDGVLSWHGVNYVPASELERAEADLAELVDLDDDGLGAVVAYRVTDRVTGQDLSGHGVIVRAAGADNASVRVLPLGAYGLEVDAAALSPASAADLA